MDHQHQDRRSEHGAVSLAELLAVVGLLALVVGLSARSVASIDLGFGSNIALAAEAGPRIGLDALRALVQRASEVTSTDSGRLDITSAEGRVTTVFLDRGVLRAAHPGGAVDDLLSGVEGVSFEVHRSRRLIDAEPLVEHGRVWDTESPDGTSQAVVLEAGRKLALGFTLRADAPDGLDTVEEIDEELIEALLGQLSLRAGRIDGHGLEFCHLRDEAPHVGVHAAGLGLLTLELFEARAPGDARPTGKRLSSLSVPMSEVPDATYNWFDLASGEEALPPEILSPRAGVNRRWWKRHPEVVLNVTPTLERIAIGLEDLQAVVLPGRAYTLVLGTSGDDLLVVEAVDTGTASGAGVAVKPSGGRAWEVQSLAVWHAVDGQLSFSRTAEVFMPRSVDIRLQLEDEVSLDETLLMDGSPVGETTPVPRRPGIQLEGAGRVSTVEQQVERLLGAASSVPVTRLSGRTLLQDTELDGLVILEKNSVLYLDGVVLRGAIVSGPLSGDENAPRIVVDGALRIASSGVLSSTAIYLPGGEIRTAAGILPALQIEGDLIARALSLEGRGAIHGQVAAVGERHLGVGIEQPRICRSRRLRPPGLER
jgi:hypothetical protein